MNAKQELIYNFNSKFTFLDECQGIVIVQDTKENMKKCVLLDGKVIPYDVNMFIHHSDCQCTLCQYDGNYDFNFRPGEY